MKVRESAVGMNGQIIVRTEAASRRSIWVLGLFAAGLLFALLLGVGSPLRLGLPIASTLIGIYFLRTAPGVYIAFLLSLWFLSPLVRRVVDFRAGWQDPSTLLLTPYLVTLLSVVPLLFKLRRPSKASSFGVKGTMPPMFTLALLGILFGLPVGVAHYSASTVIMEVLNWLVPILFGWYIAVHQEYLLQYRRGLVWTFVASLPILGGYGLYQFLVAPAWDRDWLQNVPNVTTMGAPEPYEIRVFSTMHSPAILGLTLVIGILFWLASPHWWSTVGGAVAIVSLLLTQARTAWAALIVGLVLLVTALGWARLVIYLIALGLVAVPLSLTDPLNHLIGDRMSTMTSISSDQSASDRMNGHIEALRVLGEYPLGKGLGAPDTILKTAQVEISLRDGVFLSVWVQLGIIGSALYITAMVFLLREYWKSFRARSSPEDLGIACAGLALLSQCYLGPVVMGPVGMFVWGMAGLCLAGSAARTGITLQPPAEQFDPSEVERSSITES